MENELGQLETAREPGKILISAKEGRLVLDIYAIVTATLSAGSLCVEWV